METKKYYGVKKDKELHQRVFSGLSRKVRRTEEPRQAGNLRSVGCGLSVHCYFSAGDSRAAFVVHQGSCCDRHPLFRNRCLDGFVRYL